LIDFRRTIRNRFRVVLTFWRTDMCYDQTHPTWQLGARASAWSPDGSCTEELIDYADPVGEEQAEAET
jgi:hypothetical protein